MISVTILTKNSEKYLRNVLDPLQAFDEVVVFDTGSQDTTLAIAKTFPNVSIYQAPFEGFGPTHNVASNKAKNDWILSVDSDEILEKELINEIRALSLDPNSVYSFRRKNFYKGVFIRGCGWWPDRVTRLYNRRHTSFNNAFVHESIQTAAMHIVKLNYAAIHFPYATVSDFLHKMESYTTLFAKEHAHKKKSSLTKAITHSFFAFIRSYFLKRGFLLGSVGLEISLYNANCAFYKYLKLKEQNDIIKKP